MRKTQVSVPRQKLVELMQEIQYGTVEHLVVSSGEPVLDPHPDVMRDVALGKQNGPHPSRALRDFELKREVLELFDLFDRERDLSIDRIVVQSILYAVAYAKGP